MACLPWDWWCCLANSVMSVQKFNLSQTQFIRFINHLLVSYIEILRQYAKRKIKKKKKPETGERILCVVQGILILIDLDYG